MATDRLNPDSRIYPMGLHVDAKSRVLALVPEKDHEEALRLLRTGEEVAVIFAKVSRSPSSFEQIAAEVSEEGAARFHGKWTVSVEGYGHKSVGEHAPIHLAVENVSSLDGDEITDNRLGSYTEFSARFKGRQSVGYFTPETVEYDTDLAAVWHETHSRIFEVSDVLTDRARRWIFSDEATERFPQLRRGAKNPGESEVSWRSRLGKNAADQFKNMLPASRLTSIGVTWNATEAENAIRKILSGEHISTREVGAKLKAAALEVAPTLVKYADRNDYLESMGSRRDTVLDIIGRHNVDLRIRIDERDIRTDVVSVQDPEASIIAAFAFESLETGSFTELLRIAERLTPSQREAIFSFILKEDATFINAEDMASISRGLGEHEMPPRAFEFDGGYVFQFRNMTYGDWRDYKRHRMQSYIAKPLSTQWGFMVPPMIDFLTESSNPDFEDSWKLLHDVMSEVDDLYQMVRTSKNPQDAEYVVTRLHYRPAIAHFNLREAFHLLRLRTGDTAHPFVRRLMWPTYDALMERHPSIISGIKTRGTRTEVPFP